VSPTRKAQALPSPERERTPSPPPPPPKVTVMSMSLFEEAQKHDLQLDHRPIVQVSEKYADTINFSAACADTINFHDRVRKKAVRFMGGK